MATYTLDEWSGFFNAMIVNGQYDRVYNAEHFADYFANFISSGVFAQPTDQLKISADEGLTVSIKAGKAYIKGYAYTLRYDSTITFEPNSGSASIICKVVVEYLPTERIAKIRVIEGADTALPDNEYQLVLCSFTLPVGASEITEAMLSDRRPDEDYCGFVVGLVKQIDFKTLMEQDKAQFNEWFEEMKGQLSEDAAGNLQNQIDNLGNIYLSKENYVLNKRGVDGYVLGASGSCRSWILGGKSSNPDWSYDWRAYDNYCRINWYDGKTGDLILHRNENAKGGGYFTKLIYSYIYFKWIIAIGGTSIGYQSVQIDVGGKMVPLDQFLLVPNQYYSDHDFDITPPTGINKSDMRFGDAIHEDLDVCFTYKNGAKIGTLSVTYYNVAWFPDDWSKWNVNYETYGVVYGIWIESYSMKFETAYSDCYLNWIQPRYYGIGSGFDPKQCYNVGLASSF